MRARVGRCDAHVSIIAPPFFVGNVIRVAGYMVEIFGHCFDGQVPLMTGLVLVNSCDLLEELGLVLRVGGV